MEADVDRGMAGMAIVHILRGYYGHSDNGDVDLDPIKDHSRQEGKRGCESPYAMGVKAFTSNHAMLECERNSGTPHRLTLLQRILR